MRSTSGIVVSLLIAGFLGSATTGACAPTPSTRSGVTSNEIAVYGAVLDSLEKVDKDSDFLIAGSASTFECGKSSCNGFSMGGCNGLRTANETASERLAIVNRDLPKLQGKTAVSFEKRNQQCSSIDGSIPTAARFRYLNGPSIPRDWKDKYIIYFSRVGINPKRMQALVDISLISWMDGTKSGGRYILLNKVGGKWAPAGSSAV